jgi:hypothetical protein
VPANLPNLAAGTTFDIEQIRIKKNAGAFGTSNIELDFNEVAFADLTDITIITS